MSSSRGGSPDPATGSGGAALADLIVETATPLADTEIVTTPAGRELRRGAVTFASIAATGGAEFRLDRAVAAAAVRTPDTVPSQRGPGWIAFTPAELDDHARDRARAWLTLAWRTAEA
jgi:hypothetical protein